MALKTAAYQMIRGCFRYFFKLLHSCGVLYSVRMLLDFIHPHSN